MLPMSIFSDSICVTVLHAVPWTQEGATLACKHAPTHASRNAPPRLNNNSQQSLLHPLRQTIYTIPHHLLKMGRHCLTPTRKRRAHRLPLTDQPHLPSKRDHRQRARIVTSRARYSVLCVQVTRCVFAASCLQAVVLLVGALPMLRRSDTLPL